MIRKLNEKIHRISFVAIGVICGAVAMFGWFTWQDMASERQISVRAPEVVLNEVEKARSILHTEGVYWFSGNKGDATQLEEIIELLEPSIGILVMRAEGVEGFPLVQVPHSIFDNGNMSMTEVEQVLLTLKPE